MEWNVSGFICLASTYEGGQFSLSSYNLPTDSVWRVNSSELGCLETFCRLQLGHRGKNFANGSGHLRPLPLPRHRRQSRVIWSYAGQFYHLRVWITVSLSRLSRLYFNIIFTSLSYKGCLEDPDRCASPFINEVTGSNLAWTDLASRVFCST